MPINKFGQHFLNSPSPIDLNQLASIYFCEPTSLYSKCFLRLKGTKNKKLNKTLYILENEGTAFVFPLGGKIESVRHYKADGLVLLNSKSYKYNQLSGTTINKGDKIEFQIGTPDVMCADFIIQCPLEKNV